MEEKHITSLRGNYIFLKKTIGMVMTLSFTSPSPRFSPTHPPRAGDIYSLLSNIAANSLLIKYVGYILLNNILVIFYMSFLNIVRYLCLPRAGDIDSLLSNIAANSLLIKYFSYFVKQHFGNFLYVIP
jgi:ABC-type cobalt transport system substrate-binding protein